MPTVDSLDIKISAQANSANKAIGALSQNLSTLSHNLGKLNGSGLSNFSSAMQNLSAGMEKLQGIKAKNFTPIASGIKKFESINTGKISSLSGALTPLANGINIFSSAKFDNKNLQNLINSLTRLSNANVENLARADFAKIGDSINELTQKLSGSKEVSRNVTSLINAVGRLASAGDKATIVSAALPDLGNKLKDFIAKLSGSTAVEQGTIALTDAISRLANAGAKTGTTANGLSNLSTETLKFIQTLSTAPKVSAGTTQLVNAIANLANAGGRASLASRNLSNRLNVLNGSMSGLRIGTGKAISSLKSFSSQLLSSMGVYLGIYGAIKGIKSAIDISSDLTEVQNVVDVTFGDMAGKVEEFAQTSIQQFGMSELSLKQYASRFQAMGSAMGINSGLIKQANDNLSNLTNGYVGASDSMSDVSLNLTKLTADMASFYNVEQEAVAEDLAAIFTGQTRPLREYGLDLTQATLQEWAMKQGLDANIQSMSQAEKTMLRYQYVLANTTAAQGDFARTADTWANQTRILKQNIEQLGAVLGTAFINMLKPLVSGLNQAMLKITTFAQNVVNALGVIFGWKLSVSDGGITQDFEDAAGYSDNLANSTGAAAKNVEKIQKSLRSFDELKIINLPEDDTGAGGRGEGGTGGAGTSGDAASNAKYQLEETESLFKSKIDTLYKLGDYIGKTLTDAMNSIDWDSIYEKARNFGTGLAQFLNGLISPELFGALGRTISGSLNTALNFLDSFGETFDWTEFGISIATGINDFFGTFDLGLLADTIDTWVQGIWNTIKTAIGNIKWEDVWNGIKEFLSNIDIKTVAIVIGAISIKKILSLHLASTALTWIGTEISKKIAQSIASTLGLQIASNAGIRSALMAAGASVGTTFVAGFKALLGSEAAAGALSFINPVIKGITGISSIAGGAFLAISNFVKMIKDGFSWLNEILMVVGVALAAVGAAILGAPALVAGAVAAIVATIGTIVVVVHDNWDSIIGWFSDAADWFNTNVITPISNFFQGLWKNVSGFFKNLWDEIVSIWSTVFGWFNTNVIEPVVGLFQGFWTRVQQIFEGLWLIVQAIWKVASGWFSENVIIPIKNLFNKLKEKVGGFFANLWTKVKEIWASVSGWFSENVINPVANKFDIFKQRISTVFNTLWSVVKWIWQAAFGWFYGTVIFPIENSFKTATDSIGRFFGNLWDGIKGGVKSAMNSVISSIESGVNWMINGVNNILKGFNKIASEAAKIVGNTYGGVDLIPTIRLPRLETGGYFPKQYSIAMVGENGIPEIMGTVGGQPAVAGGVEITGIKDAVYSTSQQEIELLRQQNQLLQAILEKEYGISKDDIGKAARDYALDYHRKTGNPAYSF